VSVSDQLAVLYLLSTGPLIGFSGTVFTDRLQLECLTECFTLHTNAHESAMPTRVARAFGAFRIAFNKLRTHYKDLSKKDRIPHTLERDSRLAFPYPDSYFTESGEVKFTYRSRFDNGKLIFVAMTSEETMILVKFTRRYSEEAHRYCAQKGVAPVLLGFRTLPAGWYMVVMEYLDPQTHRVLGDGDCGDKTLELEIKRVVKVLHDGGFVHGDIRNVNVMTPRHRGAEGMENALLLDFDWAGRGGIARYPPNINSVSVERHEGVKDGGLITRDHDLTMVTKLFLFDP